MVTGLFALGGAIIGGGASLAAGVVELRLRRRSQKRVAVRLLEDELVRIVNAVDFTRRHGWWWQADRLERPVMTEYRAVLADVLSADAWGWLMTVESETASLVAQRASSLRRREARGDRLTRRLDDDERDELDTAFDLLRMAMEGMGFKQPTGSELVLEDDD